MPPTPTSSVRILSPLEECLHGLDDAAVMRLLSYMEVDDIVHFAKTSSSTRSFCQLFAHTAWNFNAFFNDWFANTEAFREALSESRALVSRSQVLQFFERTSYANSDLDLYLQAGGFETINVFVKSQGYERQSQDSSRLRQQYSRLCNLLRATRGNCIVDVISYRRRYPSLVDINQDGSSRMVQVIVVSGIPVCFILFEYHSSAVINYITSNEAVCVFPQFTLLHKKSFITPNGKMCEKWREKYISRGFELVGDTDLSRLPLSHKCWVFDCHTWVVPFAGDGVNSLGKRPLKALHPSSIPMDIMFVSGGQGFSACFEGAAVSSMSLNDVD
ncbi:hypothetical protein CPB83DRAFT_897435 [Crepidotus variabilis]|uniref:F-box domain-containing protein n=1 Tax=Crepidotus variabilis TaxID=179855 RepID=A0A9P6E9G8_9AGAR|nr:hypothetical protein CPB83DRAFT_897435 [Crepidotus variabilis]